MTVPSTSPSPNAYGGYAGRLLRVDLTRGRLDQQPTADYLPDYYGGRALAARIAWDEIPPGAGAFDPENRLLVLAGPLAGTGAPFAGRTTICGLSAQGHPHEWYTRSSLGGHFASELKRAGFDGLVIHGRAPAPVYLRVEDGAASLEDARPLWGLGIYESQQRLLARLGPDWRVLAIGPAGENLCRVAIAATETESASGQGGFGAVMGAKNLKAVAVRGRGRLTIADPARFERICRLVRAEAHGSHGWPHTPRLDPDKVRRFGQKFQACTEGCAVRCYDARFYTTVPAVMQRGKVLAGQVDCIAGLFPGFPGSFYDWKLGFEAGFEVGQIANDLGLNHWEILVGLVPWLRALRADGELTELDGRPIDLDDPWFWRHLLEGMAFRRGRMGAALAEGTVRAAAALGLGGEHLAEFFAAWGYAGHWDGHGDRINYVFFPFWVVSALQWAVDTRDPISSAHGYAQNIMGWSRICSPEHGLDWETIRDVSARVYGSRACADPASGYRGKAFPAYWHGHRSVMKDSLPVDDQVFPRIYSNQTEDHFAAAGGIPGPSFERHMFAAATGIDWDDAELERASARTLHLERTFHVRAHGRSRADDESLIPYFERPEQLVNPLIGERVGLDAAAFRGVLDEYYALRGWERASGRPTRATLEAFDLAEEAEELARRGLLPEVGP